MRRWLTLLLILISVGGWLLGWSPYLRVTSIEVVGAKYVAVDNVITASTLTKGQPMARVSTARVERGLSSITRLADVRIERRWPHQIVLHVRERRPIAKVGNDVIDRNGVRFSLTNGERSPTMNILITDFSRPRVREWIAIYRQLPFDIRKMITDVSLRSIDDISFRAGKVEYIWGSAEQTPLKVSVLQELLTRPNASTWVRLDLSAPLAPTTSKQ